MVLSTKTEADFIIKIHLQFIVAPPFQEFELYQFTITKKGKTIKTGYFH